MNTKEIRDSWVLSLRKANYPHENGCWYEMDSAPGDGIHFLVYDDGKYYVVHFDKTYRLCHQNGVVFVPGYGAKWTYLPDVEENCECEQEESTQEEEIPTLEKRAQDFSTGGGINLGLTRQILALLKFKYGCDVEEILELLEQYLDVQHNEFMRDEQYALLQGNLRASALKIIQEMECES